MTRRDIVAIVTFVLGIGGGLYWRATRPEPLQPGIAKGRTAILTYLEVTENGWIRIRGGRSVEPCKVGALWTDAEGRHECIEYHEPASGECDLGDVYLGDDGIWSQCLPSDVSWLIGECSDGKRLTPEGKIVACEEPKP
jgi:hypothetical protein